MWYHVDIQVLEQHTRMSLGRPCKCQQDIYKLLPMTTVGTN